MTDDARTRERLDALEGEMLVVKTDVATLKRDRDAFGPIVLGKLDAIASTLGTSPTSAPESAGSGLCREVAELKAIEDEKRREKEAAAAALAAAAKRRTERAEQVKTIASVVALLVGGFTLAGVLFGAATRLLETLKGWL